MNKHVIVIGIAVLLICIGLNGCTETTTTNEIDKFVGSWGEIMSNGSFEETVIILGNVTFYKNATGESYLSLIFPETFNYSVLEGELSITFSLFDEYPIVYNYSFSDNNTKLTLINIANEKTTVLVKT